MKKVIIVLFILVGCKSSKDFYKGKFYTEVEEEEVKKHYKEYTVKIPENWFSYRTDPNLMAHSPNEFKNSIKPSNNATWFIIRNSFQASKKLEKNSKQFISNKKKYYKNFYYVLHEKTHKIYGKYYIVQYSTKENNATIINITCVLKAKNKIYNIYFSGTTEKYDKYLDNALEMINSFTLKK